MVDVTPADAVPPAEVGEMELYHPRSWVTKYVFSQDAKVIAVQYSCTALAIGLVALVLSWLMRLQLGFPGTSSATGSICSRSWSWRRPSWCPAGRREPAGPFTHPRPSSPALRDGIGAS